MGEKTIGQGENKNSTTIDRSFVVGGVPLSHITLNPEERLRLESGNYKDLPKYVGIKSTMEMFGQYHTITLRRKGNKDYLLGGFLRFCIAVELGWKEIGAKTYFDLSDYEATIIEITENTNRIDFTSYEVIMAIGKAKTEWERLHPNTGRGKYNRSRSKNKTITVGETVMQSQNHQDITGFVKKNHRILGIAEITLYRRIQLYNAIKNNTFDKKTVDSFKNEKITYSQLLNKLRKIENKKKIRSNLEASSTFNVKILSPPNDQKNKEEELSVPRGSSKLLSDAKNNWKKVKRQEISLEKGFENSQKIKQVNKSIKEGIVKKFEEAGKGYKGDKKKSSSGAHGDFKYTEANKNKKNTLGFQHPISIKQMYICKRCPKATVMAVECECEECGHLNFAPTVLCDDDIINGFSKLRNPNSVLCEKSPDYDLVLKRVL